MIPRDYDFPPKPIEDKEPTVLKKQKVTSIQYVEDGNYFNINTTKRGDDGSYQGFTFGAELLYKVLNDSFSQSIPAGKGTANDVLNKGVDWEIVHKATNGEITIISRGDNEVFAIGDEVEYRSAECFTWDDKKWSGKINWIRIIDGSPLVEIDDNHEWNDDVFPHKRMENIRHKPTANETINEEKKDWEIVEFRNPYNYPIVKNEFGKWHLPDIEHDSPCDYEDVLEMAMVEGGNKIHSVKRLSDNEVLSVKDITTYGEIKSFEIAQHNEMRAWLYDNGGGEGNFNIEKLKKKKPTPTANDVSNVSYPGVVWRDRELGRHWLRYTEGWSRKRLLDLIEFTRVEFRQYTSKNIYDQFIATDKYVKHDKG